jgi:ATP-dependent RNA helicase RhlE
MSDFASFGLAAPILSALVRAEYTTPTPIQAQAIPHVMRGADLLGIAQTGTGKTAAFALPIIHRLMADRRPYQRTACRCLVLAPTRELASQIAESFRTYGRQTGLRVAVIFGGVPKGRQIQAVQQGVDVVVATPGRLLDLFSERHIRLDQTEILVLDEADHMLDLGFVIPIRRIAKELPAQRQNLFFSATMPKAGRRAAEKPCAGLGRTSGEHRGARRAMRHVRAAIGKAHRAGPGAPAAGHGTHAGVRPHQAWRGPHRAAFDGDRPERQRHPRQ